MHQHHRTIVFDKLKRRLRKRDLSNNLNTTQHNNIIKLLKQNSLSKHSKINSKSFKLNNSNNLKYLAHGLPVVCIISLLGILSYSFGVGTWFSQTEAVHASETTSAQSDPLQPKATLDISAAEGDYGIDNDKVATMVTGNGMAYRSHNITLDVNDITKYTLTLSYASGKDALRLEGASTYFANVGTDGKKPAAMADNTWGFAWDNTNVAEKDMTYYTVPQFGASATDLSTGLLASNDTYSETFTKKLTFGAKFGSNNDPGHYKTAVMLSLTASAKEVVTTLDDLQYMQDMTPEVCASSIIGESAILQDRRDGNAYMVYKLEDDNCWMTENLRLTSQSLTDWKAAHPDDDNNLKLTSKYSNVAESSTYSLPITFTSASQWTSTSTSLNATLASKNSAYGAYYSAYAATAGTPATTYNQEATSSICPSGWRLPTLHKTSNLATGYNYSYNKLINVSHVTDDAAGSTKLQGAPYNFQLAGNIGSNGSVSGAGTSGYYWSTTADNSASIYMMKLNTGNVNLTTSNGRSMGQSVRCVAERELAYISTMQEMTSQICGEINIGTTKALTDIRGGGYMNDGKANSYIVKKLSDGNCWMVQNLNLINKTITAIDSNVGSDYIIPDSSLPWSDISTTTNKVYYPYLNNDDNRYGAYYTWYAATAGSSGNYASICPKGWRLPTGGSTGGEIGTLYGKGFKKVGTFAENSYSGYWFGGNTADAIGGAFFPAAGSVYGDSASLKYVGTSGSYWTNTEYEGYSAYGLIFGTNGVSLYDYLSRRDGHSVRCIVPGN